MPLSSRTADWLKSHNAFVLFLLTGRRARKLLVKFNPDQPRAPAGQPDGGQWVRVGGGGGGGGGGIGGGFPLPDLRLTQELYPDETGEATWDYFLNSYTEDGDLAAQIVVNEDDSVTTTEWDTGGVESWAVRQTVIDADRAVVTTAELGHNGLGQVTFGPGAEGHLVLAAVGGQLDVVPAEEVPGPLVAFAPTQGDVIKPLSDNVFRIIPGGAATGAAGAGAFVFGMTAFSSPAGGESYVPLSGDVRLAFQDNGRLPAVQERIDPSWTDLFSGGTWRTLPDVPVAEGPAGTLTIGGDALRHAIGQKRFDALGPLDGRDVWIAMQPSPVAPRDVPPDSIFAGDRPTGLLHSPQGTVVD